MSLNRLQCRPLAALLVVTSLICWRSAAGQVDCPHEGSEDEAGKQAASGPPLRFPNEGTINALIIFVQHEDDRFEHY